MLSAKYNDSMNVSDMAAALGRRGGLARSRRLSDDEKSRIASLGGVARRQSLLADRRIVANFRYAAVLKELRGQRAPVRRLKAFAGPLPGIFRSRG